jgi:DeoR/GlpR family transcriptional regulator of sugar metabolism
MKKIVLAFVVSLLIHILLFLNYSFKESAKEERQSIILELLIQHNSILVTDLATHLNVSSVTIRKDLTDLEREKKLYRNHGKAILIDPYIDNRNVSEKEKLYVEEKRLIGMKAASLITPKDSILIASGTTMHALARSIVPADELTVITASMEVSNILASEKNIYIIQLGGILRHSSLSVVGKYAENILADFSCSKLFIGVDGIDLDFGITTTNMMEASLNRVMMQTAQKTIVLADSSKFGRRGFSKIADMEDVDHIITDSRIPPSTALRLEEMGIEVTIADSVHHNSI